MERGSDRNLTHDLTRIGDVHRDARATPFDSATSLVARHGIERYPLAFQLSDTQGYQLNTPDDTEVVSFQIGEGAVGMAIPDAEWDATVSRYKPRALSRSKNCRICVGDQ